VKRQASRESRALEHQSSTSFDKPKIEAGGKTFEQPLESIDWEAKR
jgi:hypothetical protein